MNGHFSTKLVFAFVIFCVFVVRPAHAIDGKVAELCSEFLTDLKSAHPGVYELNLRFAAKGESDFRFVGMSPLPLSMANTGWTARHWLEFMKQRQNKLLALSEQQIGGMLEGGGPAATDLSDKIKTMSREDLTVLMFYLMAWGIEVVPVNRLVTNSKVKVGQSGRIYRHDYYIEMPHLLILPRTQSGPNNSLRRAELLLYNSFADPQFDRMDPEINVRTVGRSRLLELFSLDQ